METYNNNKNFKQYVDKYCKEYRLTVAEALQHSIVREVEEQHKKNAASVADYSDHFMGRFTEVK